MASTKEYLNFVLEQLSDGENVTYRPMMGEYIIYCRGKVVGGIYDDRFLIKPTKSAKLLLPDVPLEIPYDGAKAMLLPDVDDKTLLAELISAVADDLPEPKKRK